MKSAKPKTACGVITSDVLSGGGRDDDDDDRGQWLLLIETLKPLRQR